MKTSLNSKIFIISLAIMLGGYSLAFSNSNLNLIYDLVLLTYILSYSISSLHELELALIDFVFI